MIDEDLKIPGLNIQAPWSQMILRGQKTVETRSYPLPDKHKGKMLAIIETPGKDKTLGKAKIIGLVVFSESFQYPSKEKWLNDIDRHRVQPSDPDYRFTNTKPRHGWVVHKVIPLKKSIQPPQKRGIVFASECIIPRQLLPS